MQSGFDLELYKSVLLSDDWEQAPFLFGLDSLFCLVTREALLRIWSDEFANGFVLFPYCEESALDAFILREAAGTEWCDARAQLS